MANNELILSHDKFSCSYGNGCKDRKRGNDD
jgi:hypothetical protein